MLSLLIALVIAAPSHANAPGPDFQQTWLNLLGCHQDGHAYVCDDYAHGPNVGVVLEDLYRMIFDMENKLLGWNDHVQNCNTLGRVDGEFRNFAHLVSDVSHMSGVSPSLAEMIDYEVVAVADADNGLGSWDQVSQYCSSLNHEKYGNAPALLENLKQFTRENFVSGRGHALGVNAGLRKVNTALGLGDVPFLQRLDAFYGISLDPVTPHPHH